MLPACLPACLCSYSLDVDSPPACTPPLPAPPPALLCVCVLQLFSATELERLVCGNPFLDFEGLQKSARYEGGYSPGGLLPQLLLCIAGRCHRWSWQLLSCFAQYMLCRQCPAPLTVVCPLLPAPSPSRLPRRAPRGPVAVAGRERADARGAQALPQVLHRL